MSYEPTLVILKKDLDKHQDFLENGSWQYIENKKEEATRGGEEGKTVLEYIRDVYTQKPVKIAGIELLICRPCFTTYNKSIRKKLDKLEVEYAETY